MPQKHIERRETRRRLRTCVNYISWFIGFTLFWLGRLASILVAGLSIASVVVGSLVALEYISNETSTEMMQWAVMSKLILVAPTWLDEPRTLNVKLGADAETHCCARGFPPPDITMMRQVHGSYWVPVPPPAFTVEQKEGSNNTIGKLVIKNMNLDHCGLYRCDVYNGVGRALHKTFRIIHHL